MSFSHKHKSRSSFDGNIKVLYVRTQRVVGKAGGSGGISPQESQVSLLSGAFAAMSELSQ